MRETFCKHGVNILHAWVITKSVSRFARNTVDSLNYVRRLKAMGIGVFFEEQNIDTLTTDSENMMILLSGE